MSPYMLASLPVFSFLLTYFLVPPLARRMSRRGIVGEDIHKLDRPKIPEMCGLSLWPSTLIPLIFLSLLDPPRAHFYLALFSAVVVAGCIGVRDDLKPLNPKVKPALTAAAGIPILLLSAYSPSPHLPFIGGTRLTIVYPFLVLIALAVTSNAVNMMDVFNGVMPGTCAIVTFTAFITLLVLRRTTEAALPLILLGGLLAFYLFNRYPARVFAGDSGSLFVGAALGSIAIIGRIEIVMIVALMPHIMNAYYGLSSIGRLYERREVEERPTVMLPDGRIDATKFRGAPITLTRLILAQGPLDEKAVARFMAALTAASCLLAVLTIFLIPGMVR